MVPERSLNSMSNASEAAEALRPSASSSRRAAQNSYSAVTGLSESRVELNVDRVNLILSVDEIGNTRKVASWNSRECASALASITENELLRYWSLVETVTPISDESGVSSEREFRLESELRLDIEL
mmetsp:Transcript_4217/g.11557  ORF Transcript_4217/g.11557 Transcript_4217/m.11557 type:complete len:126 (-) Transcript_4217:95-472(-)